MRVWYECALLLALVVCAYAAPRAKRTLSAVILFTVFGLMLSVVWLVLECPDLAITEAALGAGVTGVLFFRTLKNIHALKGTDDA